MDIIYRYDPYAMIEPKTVIDGEAAILELEKGHGRFRTILTEIQKELIGGTSNAPVVIPSDPLSLGLAGIAGAALQSPYALVLGCSDARVPIERIFDQSSNALFVVRVAGNVLGSECLGSIDYAVHKLRDSLKLLVVLGHTGCGAVTAAVDTYLSPHDYPNIAFTHTLRSLVDRLHIAVRGAAKSLRRSAHRDLSQEPGYRAALVETAVYLNAALTAFDVQKEIDTIRAWPVRVVYGVFDIEDQKVHGLPHHAGDAAESWFGDVPESTEAFTDLGNKFANAIMAKYATP